MKKFSKIILVLLTLSLVFGAVFSISASAATTAEMLNVSGAANNKYSDFDSVNTIVPAFAWASGSKGNVIVTKKVDSNGNTYVNYAAKTKNSTSTSTIEGWVPVADYGWGPQRNGQSNIGAHDYVTIDFEIGTDKYSYKDAAGVWHTVDKFTDIPEAYRPADPHTALAFYNGMSININGRGADVLSSAGAKNSNEKNFAFIYTVQDATTGKWYLSADNKYSAGDLELSNELGVYDHITYVFQVKRTFDTKRTTDYNFNGTKAHAFLNGEFLCTSNVSTDHDSTAPNAIRFFIPEADRTSFCVDNVAINWYGHREMKSSVSGSVTFYKYSTVDTVYKSEGYGIDDYITSNDYLTKPLYMCDEVVYGVNYSFVGSPTAVELIHEDGTTDKYSNVFAATQNVKAGDFVHMYKNVPSFTPSSFDIDEVTFVSHKGSTLTLSDEAKEFYKLQHTGDRYTIRLATGGITLNWYDGVNETPVKTQSLVPFVAPTNNSKSLNIHGEIVVTDNTATIDILRGWKWDKDNDKVGESDLDEIFKAHTVEGLNKLMEQGILVVNIYPIYETLPLLYTVETMDSEGIANPDFLYDDYESFTDFDSFISAVSGIKEAKVTLYADLANPALLEEVHSIDIAKNAIVNFDMNGHSITSTTTLFAVSEKSQFNLYSTEAGAQIEAPAVIGSAGIDACEVNIDGENLEVTADSVLSLVGSADDVANANKIVININGGKYTGTEYSSVLFHISEMDMIINITGADIAIDPDATAFSVNTAYKTSAEINIVDSKIIADSAIGSWSNTCKMYIENSVVSGLDLSVSGITLGAYNLIGATEFDASSIHTTGDVTLALASEGKLTVSGVNVNVLTYDASVDAASRPAPFDEIAIDSVLWLAPDGSTYATTYWVAGSEIDISSISADSFGIDKNIEGNGWFTFAYSTWERDTAAQGVVYKPVAKKIVQALDEVYVSLGISNNFMYNIYIPTPEVEGEYDIVFDYAINNSTGFFAVNGTPILDGVAKNVTVKDKAGYTRLTGDIAADEFAADTVVIRYMVNGQLLEKTITIDIFEYADKVDAAYGCGTDESKLVYAMLQYKLAVYKAAKGNAASSAIILAVEDQLASHGINCKCGEVSYTAPEESVDYSAIASLVKGFAYTLELNGVAKEYESSYSFSIYFKKDSGVTAVSGAEFVKYETADYIEYRLSGINVSDLNEVIEFSVDGTAATYSLAKYIADSNSEFAKAMYVIAAAAQQ